MSTKVNRLFPNLAANDPKKNLLNADSAGKGKLLSPEILEALTSEIPLTSASVDERSGESKEIIQPPFQNQIQTISPEQHPDDYLPTKTIGETQTSDFLQNPVPELNRSRVGRLYPNLAGGNQTSAEIQSRIDDLSSADMGREDSFKNRLLSGLFKGVKAWSENGGQGGLAGLAGAAATGGIGSAASPNFHGELRRNDLKSRLFHQLGEARKQEEFQANLDYKKAQTATIPIDDENKRLEIQQRREAAQDRLKGQALNKLFGGKHFDPNNPVHRELAKSSGLNPEDLKGWDDRDPKTKTVAGITYQYDYKTGSYVQSNLPVDESQALTDYKVKMPNGEFRTYKVSNKDAANFATQMQALGARIEESQRQFDKRLKLDTEKFAQAKQQFASIMDLRQKAFAAQEEARRINNSQEQQKWELEVKKFDAMIVKMQQAARESTELDEDQFNELETLINGLKR